ncbi:uncharacterized protein LOC135212524 isoform X2 [Macrobrachium nipponense]|uniref:uncharacterized protein LOC135212524 isoform X2 n=1 Tax=Macrobrachium nipponense TaxID=159736 RepID=UPI0030C7E1E5
MNRLLSLCLVLQCIVSAIAAQYGISSGVTLNTSLNFTLPPLTKILLLFWLQENTPITLEYLYDDRNTTGTGKLNYQRQTETEPYFILIYPDRINMSKPATVESPLKLDPQPRSLTGRVLKVFSEKNVTWEMYTPPENGDDETTSPQYMIVSLAASSGLMGLIAIILAFYVCYLKTTTTKLQPDVSSADSRLKRMASHDSENSLYGAVIR